MKLINPSSLVPPRGYNNGVLLGPGALLCLAGQIGCDAEGRIVSDELSAQFDRALANLLAIVAEAGGRPEDVGQLTIYVTDKAEYVADRPTIGKLYRRRMGRHYPAMSLVEVKSLLEPRAKVEIEGIAVVHA